MTVTVSGLGNSNLDVSSLVSQLMQVESIPKNQLQSELSVDQSQISAWQTLGTQLGAVRTAAQALATPALAAGATATSSNAAVVTASAITGATPGSVALTVSQLATAQQVASAAYASPTELVGAGTVAVGALGGLGVTGVSADATATAGLHHVTVSQASAAATITGATLSPPLVVTAGTNDQLTLIINGVPHTVTIPPGTYTNASTLAAAVEAAGGGGIVATADGSSLQLRTADQGSQSSLSIGTSATADAAATLGLSAGTSATGSDGVIDVDGTDYTVNHLDSTGTVTAGGLTLSLGNGLQAGSGTVVVAQTDATTTLSDLSASLGVAGGPLTSSVVSAGGSGTSAYLVLSATQTGTANALQIGSTLGGLPAAGFTTITAAADAHLQMGSLSISRSSNTISDLIPDVTLTLTGTSTSPVTVTTSTDIAGTTSKLQDFVNSLNTVIGTAKADTAYDVSSQTGGPLVGDNGASSLGDQIFAALQGVSGTGTTKALSQLGFTVQQDGTYQLDTAALAAQLAADPAGATQLLADAMSSVSDLVGQMTGSSGVVSSSTAEYTANSKTLQSQIDGWTTRLAEIQANYTQQFSALQASLQAMDTEQTLLGSLIAGINANSGITNSSSSHSSS
ncbi:MAG TPA: flagellar filament capping protein FliD [Mycobacteriales bacterium]|nr:flagellar filament capping protein FliD [Mycobacteriales bacterium]